MASNLNINPVSVKSSNNLSLISNRIIKNNFQNVAQTFVNYDIKATPTQIQNKVDINYSNIVNDGYTPQGLTSNDEFIFISAYKNEENSRIYVYNKETNEFEYSFDALGSKAHTGGLAFDKENNLLFFSAGNGKVRVINWDSINTLTAYLKEMDNTKKHINFELMEQMEETYDDIKPYEIKTNDIIIETQDTIDKLRHNDSDSLASYIDFKSGSLYIGSFETKGHGNLVKYDLEYDKDNEGNVKNITIKNSTNYKTPSLVQGMATYSKNGEDYFIFSESLAGSARLEAYKIKENNELQKVSEISLMEMGNSNFGGIEGIEILDNGDLIGVYEFNGGNDFLNIPAEKIVKPKLGEKLLYSPSDTEKLVAAVMSAGYDLTGEGLSLESILKFFGKTDFSIFETTSKIIKRVNTGNLLSLAKDAMYVKRITNNFVIPLAIKSSVLMLISAKAAKNAVVTWYKDAKDFVVDVAEGTKDFVVDVAEGTKDFVVDIADGAVSIWNKIF